CLCLCLSLSVSVSVSVSVSLSVSQVDWESNGGLVKKLPSIREDEEGDEEQNSVSRAPRSPLRLSRGLNSPLRSPLLPPRPFRAPSEHARPTTLQIPVVSFSSAPPELSPRFVDGIETDTNSTSSQKFEFSPSLSPAAPPSPYPGTREHSEIKQSVSMLTEEVSADMMMQQHEVTVCSATMWLSVEAHVAQMNSLSKQVSKLSQELQEMTRLLKPLLQSAPPQPILMSMTPNLTPPPSSATHLSSSTCLVAPPPAPPSHGSDVHSLLDSGDTDAVDLPAASSPPPTHPNGLTRLPHSPPPTPVYLRDPPLPPVTGSFCPCCRTSPPDHPHPLTLSLLLHVSLLLTVRLPLPGPPPVPTCQLCQQGLPTPASLPGHPPPHSSHCSAPPSLSSSPGDHQLRLSPVVPLVPVSLHPSTTSLPLSLDVDGARRRPAGDTLTPPWCRPVARPPRSWRCRSGGGSRWRRGGRPQSTSASSMRRSQRYEAGT
ncbi:hypothetical protein INR49_009984, partial [Caranx melampygus]